ncbi:hypothetical protein PIN31115_01624 [Pandoraea iniqua]|uniref:Uncharacterized protein n=1 Tax=Pandoraea iniqua TaxID=2508288 RepID=A0A5E4TWF3_9BURK|nr:hypothetical protein [Pandoraea iniqua]VVD91572.1 hypothetical protein PIN31115_01624 [Pandoraea iniqua]
MLPVNAYHATPPRSPADSIADDSSSTISGSTDSGRPAVDDHPTMRDASAGDFNHPEHRDRATATRRDAQRARSAALSRISPAIALNAAEDALIRAAAELPDAALDATLQVIAANPDGPQFRELCDGLKRLPLADAQRLFGRLTGRLEASALSPEWGQAFEHLVALRIPLQHRITEAILAILPNSEDDRHGHAFALASESVEARLDAAWLQQTHAMSMAPSSGAATPDATPSLTWENTLASLRRTGDYCNPSRLTRLARVIPSLPEHSRSAAAVSTLKAGIDTEEGEITGGWGELAAVLMDVTPERDRVPLAQALLDAVALASHPAETMDVLKALAQAVPLCPEDHADVIVSTLTNFAAMRAEYAQLNVFTTEQSLDALQAVRNATELDQARRYPLPDFDALLSEALESLAERVYGT